MLAAPSRNELLAPGALAAPHAQLLNRQGTNRCQACHFAADFGVTQWSQQMFGLWRPTEHRFAETDKEVASNNSALKQSTKCLVCHQNSFPAATALEPHGVARTQLQQSTQQIAASLGSRVTSTGVPPHLQRDLECSLCHQEHHGRDFNLSLVSNQQCQVCHVAQFASFADGHPEFGNWPYAKFPRLAFDHVRHQATHFAKSNREFVCNDCHRSTASRDVVAVAPFEQACAGCHDQALVQSQSTGITILGLPILDTEHLSEAGYELGQWPSLASGDYDGRLPTILRFLLMADPQAARALEQFPPDFDWLDLDRENPLLLAATSELGWGIKRLFAEVATEGQPALRRRIEQVLGRSLTDREYQDSVAQLPWDLFAVAQEQWFANLSEELSTSDDTDRATAKAESSPATALETLQHPDPLAANQVPAGGWYRDPAVVAIGYRPTGHRDLFVKTWIDLFDEFDRGRPLHARLLRDFASSTSARQCASCHVITEDHSVSRGDIALTLATSTTAPISSSPVSRDNDAEPRILWQADPVAPQSTQFTWFSHGPHLVLPELVDCQACHVLAKRQLDSDNSRDTESLFPRVEADFQMLEKAQCATCHTAHSAGDACIQCHRYHATR
jgi:hypothetical protein